MKKSIAIISTCGANFASLQAACLRLGYDSIVTDDIGLLQQASHIILPGVGAAGYAMNALRERGLDHVLPRLTQPVLGICLGMQLLCDFSEEDNTSCLNIIPLNVNVLTGERIYPHMGWNQIIPSYSDDQLLQDIAPNDDLYFVHNYAPEVQAPFTQAVCSYGEPFSAYIKHNNFHGVQFHPEKSGVVGERILRNFFELSSLSP